MKRRTWDHPKMRDLAESLDVPLPHAVGILHLIWEWTGERCPEGNIGKFADKRIADAAHWTGEPTSFVQALIDSRWIDKSDEHRLLIHDWPEHCEDSIHIFLARHIRFFATGQMPKLSRLGKEERAQIEERYLCAQDADSGAFRKPTTALPLPKPLPTTAAPPEFTKAAADLTGADAGTANRMWNNARKASPDISAAEIIALITPQFEQLLRRRSVANPIAVTVIAIGDWCSPDRLSALRAQASPPDDALSEDPVFPVLSLEEQISDSRAYLASPGLSPTDNTRLLMAERLKALLEQQATGERINRKGPGISNPGLELVARKLAVQ